MKHFIIMSFLVFIFIYFIKNTDFTITSYLIQILLALLTYKIIVKVRSKRKERKGLPK